MKRILAVVTLAYFASSCGPVGIGAIVASGDDDSSGDPPLPSATVSSASVEQPFANRTVLAFALKRDGGGLARVRLEYALGQASRPITAEHLSRQGSAAPLGFDAGRSSVLLAAGRSEPIRHELVWDHAAQIRADFGTAPTRTEFRDVTVRLWLGDASKGDDELSAAGEPLWSGTAVGRQAPVVTLGTPRREPRADGASLIVFDVTFEDFAGDGDQGLWHSSLRVGVRKLIREGEYEDEWLDVADATFGPIGPIDRDSVSDWRDPVRSKQTVRFDPLSEAELLPGSYRGGHELQLEVTTVEQFQGQTRFRTGDATRNPTSRAKLGIAADLGRPPTISAVVLPDPNATAPRPWFELPIKMLLDNPSNAPVTIELDGEYRLNQGARSFAMTLLRTRRAGTARRLTLAPQSRTTHHLLWNVVADEGLGIPLESDDPRQRTVAQVRLRASIVDAYTATPRVGGKLSSRWYEDGAWRSRLHTLPFVPYREPLLPPNLRYERLVSHVDPTSTRTRDVYYSYDQPSPSSDRIGVDQSFAPIAIPGLVDRLVGDEPSGDSLNWIAPTDVSDTYPDCICNTQTGKFHYTFEPGGVAATNIEERDPIVGRRNPRAGDLAFAVRYGPDDSHRGAVIVLQDFPSDTGTGDVSRAHVNVALRHVAAPGGVWRVFSETYETAGLPMRPHGAERFPASHNFFPGEFDGDPKTTDVMFGASGTEASEINRFDGDRSFMDILSFQVTTSPALAVRFLPRIPLADPAIRLSGLLVPPLTGDPRRSMPVWYLRPLPNAAPGRENRPDLLLVRAVGAYGNERRAIELWVLRQNDTLRPGDRHLFDGQTWQLLTKLVEDTDLPLRYTLQRVSAVDLDGADGKPEIVLTLSFRNPLRARLMLLTLGTKSGGPDPICREILAIETSGDESLDYQQFQLADINGDDLIDFVMKRSPGSRPTPGSFEAYSSALAGVAGSLGSVPETARDVTSDRPAAIDLDADGSLDLIAGGRLHYGLPDGNFMSPNTQIFGSRSPFVNVAEQILAPWGDREDEIDVLTYSPGGAKVNVLERIRDRDEVRLAHLMNVRVGRTTIDTMVPFLGVVPGLRSAEPAKEIATLIRVDDDHSRLYRARMVDASNFDLDASPWLSQAVTRGAVVAVRMGVLSDRADPARNRIPQQIVVARGRELWFPNIADGSRFQVPVGGDDERIVALTNGSVTGDRFEDILVLTREGGVLRIRCVAQDPITGFDPPLFEQRLIQHEAPPAFGGSFPFAFAFNAYAGRLGHGVLLHDNQVRFVLPERVADATGADALRVRMVRSLLDDPNPPYQLHPNTGITISDFDFDGTVEVFGATRDNPGANLRLFQIDRGYRRVVR